MMNGVTACQIFWLIVNVEVPDFSNITTSFVLSFGYGVIYLDQQTVRPLHMVGRATRLRASSLPHHTKVSLCSEWLSFVLPLHAHTPTLPFYSTPGLMKCCIQLRFITILYLYLNSHGEFYHVAILCTHCLNQRA